MMISRLRLPVDPFIWLLFGVVALASLFPAQGQMAQAVKYLTNVAIALLFFMHGAKLSRQSIIDGMTHWRLHLVVFLCTFALFPLLGLSFQFALEPLLGQELMMGFLFMCALPATVQSAIAFTSIARGNLAAAICSAAGSSLLGIFITPVLVLLLMGAEGSSVGSTLQAIEKILWQLLVPFIAGQVARRWIGNWVARNRGWLKNVDQVSILLVVYGAFGEAVLAGLWSHVPLHTLLILVLVCCVFLALVLGLVWWVSVALGFAMEDRITILFGASKKSLATGVPMAQVLFSGGAVGMLLLPIMVFHQIQLVACAYLAQRFARRPEEVRQAHD